MALKTVKSMEFKLVSVFLYKIGKFRQFKKEFDPYLGK